MLISTFYGLLPPMGYVDRNYIVITVEKCVPVKCTHCISQKFCFMPKSLVLQFIYCKLS